MATNVANLSLVQLKRAVQIKEQIIRLQTELSDVLGSGASVKNSEPSSGMSAAARAKLSAAAKARWAKIKADKQRSAPKARTVATRSRKPMSATQKAILAANMKARWAKVKAAGKKNL